MGDCCLEVSGRIAADTELEGGSKKQRRLEEEIREVMARNEPYDNYSSNKWLRGSKYCSELIVPYGYQSVLRQDGRHSVTHIITG